MTIDVSAELLEISDEQYYADWEQDSVETTEDETKIIINVFGFDDAEYIDLTPVFEIITDSHSGVGDPFYLKRIDFNPRTPSATILLTTDDVRADDTLDEDYVESMATGRSYTLDSEVLGKINYTNPPLIVGYCVEKEIAIELRG